MRFEGKTVIVTGSANGIGKGIAQMFAEEGANLALSDIDVEAGKAFAQELSRYRGEAVFFETDVKNGDSISLLVENTVKKFEKIDVLINNAGISRFNNFFELTVEEWDEVINTNLRSTFLLSQSTARMMKEKGGGKIINIASTRAFMSEPNTEAYSASKGGIVALTHALARTLGPYGITVNSISPGWIETVDYGALSERDHKQHLSERVGKPDDIARACLFLSDPLNDFITGENLTIDGGMTKKMIYEE
ncbi:SDR family NAD(P)-dependent oxidoreductase [Bacillus sp. EB01]|uniref:SDR family NAD(P)-dependent oxidoreductase n=1 Tax=Bacillus sp. EB01 TaxID=1347086 RepID=UPI0005C6A818|nr:glucose 1-dehydrogenase [Bacillus sp. EB01]